MRREGNTFIILSPGFAKDAGDSTCLPAQQQFVRSLRQNFPALQVIILAFQYPFTALPYYWHGVKVIPFNGRNRGKIIRMLVWVKVWRTLNKLRKTHSITGMFSFWCTECALLGTRFGRAYHIPHYTWILGQDARRSNNYFIRLIRPQADQLVAMSDFLANRFFESHGIRPGHIIPNGISPGLYPVHSENRQIDVIGAGSLIRLKQYEIFIELVHELKNSGTVVRAIICGNGPEEQRLRNQAERLELQGNLVLTGEKPHAEILKMMQRSKILLHPSSYEGFSTVCLEALYAGAHVISFCKPMNADIPHWHVAANKTEMLDLLKQILADSHTDHSPVMPYSMEDSVRAVMNLFGN